MKIDILQLFLLTFFIGKNKSAFTVIKLMYMSVKVVLTQVKNFSKRYSKVVEFILL